MLDHNRVQLPPLVAPPLVVGRPGEPAGQGQVKRSVFRHGLEPFEVGRDSITPIDPAYRDQGQFEFPGQTEKIEFELAQ